MEPFDRKSGSIVAIRGTGRNGQEEALSAMSQELALLRRVRNCGSQYLEARLP